MKYLLILMTFFGLTDPVFSAEITEDEEFIYTTIGWNEITLNTQRALMRHFSNKLTTELACIHVPSFWNESAKKALLGKQEKFNNIHKNTQTQASTFALGQNVILEELRPIGFILGLGITGSGNFIVGLSQSALLTLIVVPYEVIQVNKLTGETITTYQASWAVGGLGQAGVTTGAGGGLAVSGAVGLIWGDLPEASSLRGTAIGVSGGITVIQGLVFKAALVINTATKKNNIVAMAAYNMGANISATIEASTFYFMNADEVIEFMTGLNLRSMEGNEIITQDDLMGS